MNLRKDHSHIQVHHFALLCEVSGWSYIQKCSRVAGVSMASAVFGPATDFWHTLSFGVVLAHQFALYFLTTFSDGCLGSISDEGRSEVR